MSGFFINIDGIDGVGKTTHLNFIKDWMAINKIDALFTREPGGTLLGEKLRNIFLDTKTKISVEAETLLVFAARQQHIQEVIFPALEQGKCVVTDRYTAATYAYQGAGKGLDFDKIKFLENWMTYNLHPDLTIILDVPLEVSFARINKAREKDRFEQEVISFFERVRSCYLELAKLNKNNYIVIDSNKDKKEVQDQIEKILENWLTPIIGK